MCWQVKNCRLEINVDLFEKMVPFKVGYLGLFTQGKQRYKKQTNIRDNRDGSKCKRKPFVLSRATSVTRSVHDGKN